MGQGHNDDLTSNLAALEGEGNFTSAVDRFHTAEFVDDLKNETTGPIRIICVTPPTDAMCATVPGVAVRRVCCCSAFPRGFERASNATLVSASKLLGGRSGVAE
jgi:hypothetical protein